VLVILRSVIEAQDLFGNVELVQRRSQARLDRDQTFARIGQEPIEPFRFGRFLNAPGQRVPVPSQHALHQRVLSLPAQAPSGRKIENIDTPANQFVKFVLLRIGSLLADALASRVYSGSALMCWAAAAESSVRRLVTNQFFSQIGRLTHLDLGSPVLQNREGYRAILRAFLMLRSGLSIRWPEFSQAVFGETRDVAKLYEIWCLLELRSALARLGADMPLNHFECTDGRLRLRRGSGSEAPMPINVGGDLYRLQLHYNRVFSPEWTPAHDQMMAHSNSIGTWSKTMKPDYTIVLYPNDTTAEAALLNGDLLLVHLDAKYRLKSLSSMLVDDGTARTYAPDDIDKMHAYAAGINGSRGAYVVYPGDETKFFLRNDMKASVGAISAAPGRAEGLAAAVAAILDMAVQGS